MIYTYSLVSKTIYHNASISFCLIGVYTSKELAFENAKALHKEMTARPETFKEWTIYVDKIPIDVPALEPSDLSTIATWNSVNGESISNAGLEITTCEPLIIDKNRDVKPADNKHKVSVSKHVANIFKKLVLTHNTNSRFLKKLRKQTFKKK